MNYECKRCFHKTKQKIEMIRHLNRKNMCIRNGVEAMKYTDVELYNLSIKKLSTKKDKKSEDHDKFICEKCNLTFHNKSNLNRHLNNKKCIEVCTSITNNITNNTLNQQNIININFNILRSFDDDWDVSKIDKTLRNMLVLSNIKYTKTLEHILDNETNLNVLLNNESQLGMVYKNGDEKFQPMDVTDIVDKSMDKLHKQLENFYNDLKNQKNEYMIDENLLDNVKNVTDKKYEEFKTNKDINQKVKELITNIYNSKRNDALKMYELLCTDEEKVMLEGY